MCVPLMCYGCGPGMGCGKRVGPGKPSKGGSWLQTGFILNRGLPQKSSETPRQLPIQGPGSLSQIRKEMERNCLATPAIVQLFTARWCIHADVPGVIQPCEAASASALEEAWGSHGLRTDSSGAGSRGRGGNLESKPQ